VEFCLIPGREIEKTTVRMAENIEKAPGEDIIDQSLLYDQEVYDFALKTRSKTMVFEEYGMLHRLNLIDLQNDIAECRAIIWKRRGASKAVREKLRVTLRDYGIVLNMIDIHGSKVNIDNSSSHPRLLLYEKYGALQVQRCI